MNIQQGPHLKSQQRRRHMTKDLSLYNPANIEEAMKFAKAMSQSGLVPEHFKGKPANILVAVQWGYEIGLKPMQSLQNIAVISGKAALWGDSLLALVKQQENFNGIKETTEGKLQDKSMVATCEISRLLPSGKEDITVSQFSMQDAEQARLLNKPGPWQQYTKRMLQLRARGFAIRDAFPDALKGLVTAEELQDYPDEAKKEPTQPVVTPDEVKQALDFTPSHGSSSLFPEQDEEEKILESEAKNGT